ncbi:MAG: DUF4097 family beta strand repeat-containing protein [Bryobacteraceae bacterium]
MAALAATAMISARSLPARRVTFRQMYALGPGGRVAIQNLYGDVSITAWDRDDVLVEAVKHASQARQLDDARIVVEPGAGTLSIRTIYDDADSHQPARVEYRLMVPRSARLEDVRLVNGGLEIRGVDGPVKASAVNGAIRAERLGGSVDLSTVNGMVDAGFERLDRGRPILLASVNGAIRLSLPAGAHASLYAHNRSGGITSAFGRASRGQGGHTLKVEVHRGGAPIHVDNVNGGILICSPGESGGNV